MRIIGRLQEDGGYCWNQMIPVAQASGRWISVLGFRMSLGAGGNAIFKNPIGLL